MHFVLMSCCLAAMSVPATACSIFMASVEGRVLFASNVDDGNPYTYYEVVPALRTDEYGYITLGFKQPQGGLNEAGLAFDTNAVRPARLRPQPSVPLHPGGPVGIATEMLQKAATVEQALAIARRYAWGDELRNQWFFADAQGDAVVISAGADGTLVFTRKPPGDGYLISTNINRASPSLIWVCRRYRVIDRLLRRSLDRDEITVDGFAEILDAAHQEAVFLRDGVLLNTEYSNIFDLHSKQITLYYWFQFDEPLTLELNEELARGPLRVRVRSLFSDALVTRAETIDRAHLAQIEKWRSFPWASVALSLALLLGTTILALLVG